MKELSKIALAVEPSTTMAIDTLFKQMKAEGQDVIGFGAGEPDFNTPEPIKEAAQKAIDENYSRYSPVAGYPALRNAIVAKLKNENGLEYTANHISCAIGTKLSVCNTIM